MPAQIGVNPDQRMHEDTRHLTELSTDLGIGLLQATLLLVSFIGVLWGLSRGFVFHSADMSFSIPGYMVWCALSMPGSASLLSWRVGRPLIELNAERYAREADLRFALVRVNEHIDAHRPVRRRGGRGARLSTSTSITCCRTMRRLVSGLTRLTWVTAGYGWFTLVAPIIVAAPVYFDGNSDLRRADDGGRRLQPGAVVAALVRRQFQLHRRLAGDAVARRELPPSRGPTSSTRRRGASSSCPPSIGHLAINNLEVASPAAARCCRKATVKIEPGERVTIEVE